MSRKRRVASVEAGTIAVAPVQATIEATQSQAALAGPIGNRETKALVIEALQGASPAIADDLAAIRLLRRRLVEKLFTPERSLNNWTGLKATN